MLLDPQRLVARPAIDRVLPALLGELSAARDAPRRTARRSSCAPACTPTSAARSRELRRLRDRARRRAARRWACAPPSAGTHPFAVWHETVVSSRRALPVGLRVDARAGAARADVRAPRSRRRCRTPRWAIRAGQPDARAPAAAARPVGQLAVLAGPRHRPGLGSHAAVPGVPAGGHPARVRATTPTTSRPSTCCIRCDAFPEPTFLWWDVRPQPRFGTVEVRIMDAQTTRRGDRRAGRAGPVHRAARGRGGLRPDRLLATPEALDENRFIAARDGMEGKLIDPDARAPHPRARRARRRCSRLARRTPASCPASPSSSRSRRWPSTPAPSAR